MQLVEVGRTCVQQEENRLKVSPAGRGQIHCLESALLCHPPPKEVPASWGQAGWSWGLDSAEAAMGSGRRQSNVLGQTGWGSGPASASDRLRVQAQGQRSD